MKLFKRITGRLLIGFGWVFFALSFIAWLTHGMEGQAISGFIYLAGGSLQLLVFAYTGVRLINNNQPDKP